MSLTKERILLAVMLVAGAASVAMADELPDTTATEELREIVVTGNSARQRINNARIGAERLELAKLA